MSEAARPRPIEACYWLPSYPVLAGEYPGHWELETSRERVRRFLGAGVSSFLDLTRPADHLEPYREILLEEAATLGIEAVHTPMPITDMGVPSIEEMATILDRLDEWAAAGRSAYVHCWGGIGRTGTVVGCYLVRHKLDGPAALATVQRFYETTGKHRTFPQSPQTVEQREFVKTWRG